MPVSVQSRPPFDVQPGTFRIGRLVYYGSGHCIKMCI
jgi:hypothetical protein